MGRPNASRQLIENGSITLGRDSGPAQTGEGWATVYAVVRRIPRGRVATYGQIARLAGRPGAARQVGYALSAVPDGAGVPWHRVINAAGRISPRAERQFEQVQRALLEREGVVFDADGRVCLDRYRWKNPGSE